MFKRHISFTIVRDDLTKVIDRFVHVIQVEINASKVKNHYVVSIHCDYRNTEHYLNRLIDLVRYGAGIYNIKIS